MNTVYTPEYIRSLLPARNQEAFDGIRDQRILGASQHISLIGDMFVGLAERAVAEQRSPQDLIDDLTALSAFFKELRGNASRAVYHALELMTGDLEKHRNDSLENLVAHIQETQRCYAQYCAQATQACVSYAVALARPWKKILIFDYSSTVEKVLRALAEDGIAREVMIPESRVIDGGRPFVEPLRSTKGYSLHFIPDAALLEGLRGCDAVLMGAETFFADGTGFNTLGSDVVGVLCAYLDIPLYFITPLIKLDIRPVYGGYKPRVTCDVTKRLCDAEQDLWSDEVDCVVSELVAVPPQQIRAYITEEGIIPAGQMFETARAYEQRITQGTLLRDGKEE